MKVWLLALALLPAAAGAVLPAPGTPGAPPDSRYCGEPERNADGSIKRNRRILREFAEVWPCPSNDLPVYGDACPGWFIDHVLPRAQGGCDMGHNLAWMNAETKTCAGHCKDRWERRVYDPKRPGRRHE